MPRSKINKTYIIFISKLWPILLTILFFAFIVTIISIYFLIPIGNKFVAKRFVNGVVFSPEQIEKNMCLKWPKLPNMENPSDGYYTYSHLLICSALFPKKQFFENGGYKIQNFNEIGAVVTYPPVVANPSLDFKNTIEIIEKTCPKCVLTKTNFNGETRGGEIERKDAYKLKGVFLYFIFYLHPKEKIITKRIMNNLNYGHNNNFNKDLGYTFYNPYAFIDFPNTTYSNVSGLDAATRKKIEKNLGEEIDAFFLTNLNYGENYIQFLAGKDTKKIHSITCVYIMDNGDLKKDSFTGNPKYILRPGSQEFSNFCASFLSIAKNQNTSFKDPISEKQIFFLKEVSPEEF